MSDGKINAAPSLLRGRSEVTDSKARAGVLAFVPSPNMAPRRAERRAATEKERYHGFRNDEERNRLSAFRERRRTLGGSPAQRPRRGRRVLLLRADHRRLLPPLVRRARRAARKCPLPRELRGGGKRRVPAVQALPAERGGSRGAPRRGRGEGLPPDRGGRGSAGSRGARRIRGHEPLSLPPRVQDGDGRHPQSLRGGATRPARARGLAPELHRDRGDLRRRLQFERALLRRVRAGAGNEDRKSVV